MKRIIFPVVIAGMILIFEFYLSSETYYTFNWIMSGIFYILSCLSLLIFVILYYLKYNKWAISILLAGYLSVVPFNLYLLKEQYDLKEESERIINWAYNQRINTGSFPKSMNVNCDSRITYIYEKENSFSLSFYIYTPNTCHFYTPKEGWRYTSD